MVVVKATRECGRKINNRSDRGAFFENVHKFVNFYIKIFLLLSSGVKMSINLLLFSEILRETARNTYSKLNIWLRRNFDASDFNFAKIKATHLLSCHGYDFVRNKDISTRYSGVGTSKFEKPSPLFSQRHVDGSIHLRRTLKSDR